MGSRGRKSAAELMIAEGPDGIVTRPDAPYTLRDPAEVAVWRAIVGAMPADYFKPTSFPLLIQYCRHSVAADRVAQLIETFCKGKKIDCAGTGITALDAIPRKLEHHSALPSAAVIAAIDLPSQLGEAPTDFDVRGALASRTLGAQARGLNESHARDGVRS